MIQDFKNQGAQITYESYGFSRRMTKLEAPRFKVDPITHRDARLGEDIVTNPANVGPGTVLRGALAQRAKATPFVLHTSHSSPYQVAAPLSQAAASLLVSIAGPAGGNPNYLDGWQLYGEFPIRDRGATHNSLLAPTGIAIDADYVWVGEGAKLWRMLHDFSSITEITPSATAIPAINGLTSDGINLFTVNGTAFYKIIISGTTYTWSTQATLAFSVAKIGCFTGKYFIGHDSGSSLIREWQMDGSLWRSIPYAEPNFMGALMLNGFVHICTQVGSLAEVQLLPARI
jgi:hypothetical protein